MTFTSIAVLLYCSFENRWEYSVVWHSKQTKFRALFPVLSTLFSETKSE